MNILFVFHDSNYYSGATRSMIDLISKLDQSKMRVIALFPMEGTAVDYLRKIDIQCICFRYFNMRCSVGEERTIYSYIKGLYKSVIMFFNILNNLTCIKEEKPDVVYTNTSSIYTGFYIARFLKLKHIWHVREFGRLDQERVSYGGEHRVYSKIARSEVVIAISQAIKEHLIANGVPKDIIHLIYDDVICEAVPEKNRIKCIDEDIVLLSCGGLQKNKGHLLAIQAVENLKKQGYNIKLKIAGDTNTDYYLVLSKYVKTHKLEEIVEFCGFVSNMKELRECCDIGIVASSSEAFGRITVEGMLSRLVIVGANSAGTSELIEDGKTGFLFEKDNLESLCKTLKYILDNPQIWKNVTESAFNNAKRFTEGNAAKKVKLLLE